MASEVKKLKSLRDENGTCKYNENGVVETFYPNKNKNKHYKGILKGCEYNGEGILYYDNGNIAYKGNFLNHNYHGKGIKYSEDKKIYDGYFKNGFYDGIGIKYRIIV
jgi:hypothetical protein